MKRTFLLSIAALVLLLSQSANAQLIGEGDTLWYKSLYPNTITQVQFSPDGTKLGVVSYDNKGVGKFIMFNAITGEEIWTFQKATYYFDQFNFSIDGIHLYILPHSDQQISVLDVMTGIVLDTFPIKKGVEVDLEYNKVYQTRDPKILLLANRLSDLALFDKEKKLIIKEKIGEPINKIYVNPNSENFINVNHYEKNNVLYVQISLWDVSTLSQTAFFGTEPAFIESGGEAKISYDGKYAATNFGGRALQIWDLENKKLFKEYSPTIPTDSTDGSGRQYSLAFCHNNEMLINCGGNYLYDTKGASTSITNFINDKRALMIDTMSGALSLDVNKYDNLIAFPKNGYNMIIYKLHKDLVPVKEYQEEPIQILYPNPTSGVIAIDLKENQLVESVRINNMKGVEVLNISKNNVIQTNTKITINLPNLDNGIYLLNLITNHSIMSYKLIMEK